MNEYRRKHRRNPDRMIEVHDVMTEAVVGRIGNLSETGLLIQSDLPLADDALYQFRFSLYDNSGHRHTLEVGAHQLWTEQNGPHEPRWIGFRFIDISPADAVRLSEWVQADLND